MPGRGAASRHCPHLGLDGFRCPAPGQVGKELPEGQETWVAGENFPATAAQERWHSSCATRVAGMCFAWQPPARQGKGMEIRLKKKNKKKNHNKYREGLTKLRASFSKPRCSSLGSPVCQAACECVSQFAKAGARPRSQIKYCACRSRARQVFLGSDLPAAASLQERLKRP